MMRRAAVTALIAWAISLSSAPALARQATGDSALSSTRLFFGPTSRVLPPGEHTFTLFMIMPTIQVGVMPRLTVAGGIFPFGGYPRLWSAKYQVHRADDHSVAGGIIQVFLPQGNRRTVGYITTTRERANSAWTLGAGAGRRVGTYSLLGTFSSPFLQLGAEKRLDKETLFVTENYVGLDFRMFSAGIRRARARETRDYNVIIVTGRNGTIVMPTVVLSLGSRPEK